MVAITNGTVIDGTRSPAFGADVVIDGDRIADVVRRAPGRPSPDYPGMETIDASGCLVTPGFVDSHSHSDAYLIVEPDAPSKISQGVTTEVNGQCGGSAAPRYGEARLSSDWASILGERLTWRSMREYREALEAARPAVNTVQFAGHNTIRSSVVGYAGRAASEDELRRMEALLEEAFDAGAHGLTTGLIYQPGRYAAPEEVERLAAVAARRGGIYATHMRSEGDGILESIDEVASLARKTGVRAIVSHLKTSGRRNWGKLDQVFERIESAIAEGIFIGSDRYPYCAAGTDLDVVLPDWAQEGAAAAECVRLADPATRKRIADEIDASGRDWSQVMIGGVWCDENKAFSGMRVREILERWKCGRAPTPGEFVCDVLAKDKCRTGAFFFTMSPENMDRILSKEWVVPCSDASLRAPWGPLGEDHPHPRAYATMPEYFRRMRSLGFSRERAVAQMTSVPAARYGLSGRGAIMKGAFADIAVWREDAFASRSTYTAPHAFASGMECVFVNGAKTFARGKSTGERAGRFL